MLASWILILILLACSLSFIEDYLLVLLVTGQLINSLKMKKKGGSNKKHLLQLQKERIFIDFASNWIRKEYDNLPRELFESNPSDSHYIWFSVSNPKPIMERTLILLLYYYRNLINFLLNDITSTSNNKRKK